MASRVRVRRNAWASFNKKFRGVPSPANPHGWKWAGYEFMEKVENWAKRWTKDVVICPVDDAHYSSSFLVLILGWNVPGRLHGVNAVLIPQNTGEPCDFFLYPEHCQQLRLALNAVMKLPLSDTATAVLKARAKFGRPTLFA